jgi:MFS family permease
MNNSSEKLSLSTKLGYGAGDLFGGGAMTIIGFYYLYFLTDIVKISPALAGIAFLVSKIWDAVSDPLMGMISDRTRTRFGRRRPYFLAGIILIFIAFFLMWFPVSLCLLLLHLLLNHYHHGNGSLHRAGFGADHRLQRTNIARHLSHGLLRHLRYSLRDGPP